MRLKSSLLTPLASVLLITSAQTAMGHGYVKYPESRSLKCANGKNTQCGAIRWEPQSVEGADGFPQLGPADGEIASAGLKQFSQLNEQTITRWDKSNVSSGSINISWHFTANHTTKDFRYYLTKPNWNPNQVLTRESFELTPFCEVDGGMQKPPVDLTHTCTLPSNRDGYHVILAVWDVGDTAASFYQAIDVIIDGNVQNDWVDVGDINPSMDLAVNDQVILRVFDEEGEQPDYTVNWRVDSTENGQANTWPKRLAELINSQSSVLQSGVMSNGQIVPVLGKNDVFTNIDSGIVRTEIEIKKAPEQDVFNVQQLLSQYTIEQGQSMITFSLDAPQTTQFSISMLDSHKNSVYDNAFSQSGQSNQSINLQNALPGAYTLTVVGQTNGGASERMVATVQLVEQSSGDYDYEYPANKHLYKTGTKVLAKDGYIYQCKPFPYEGWCRIYSEGANHYEPGLGSHWQDAWVKLP